MNDKERLEYIRRMQEAMRPMTEAEIAEMQRKNDPLMRNAADQMRGQAGMQNFWTADANEANRIPAPTRPTLWQRLKRMFMRPNAK